VLDDLTIAGGALAHSKTEVRRHQWLDAFEKEVVEFGSGLASNLNRIFEAGSRDQRYPRALPLKKGVGADRGAVKKCECPGDANFPECFHDGLRRISWSGKNFEGMKPPVLNPNAVSESAARVDGDTQTVVAAARHGGMQEG
jgi:hypothetical protein